MTDAPARSLDGNAQAPANADVAEPLLTVTNERGRTALFDRAESNLPHGWCLARLVDLVGARRSVRTTPMDARARLVAQEPPTLLRGGLTSLVSYHAVPLDALDATERHYLADAFSHEYHVVLSIARVARPAASPTR